MTKSTITVQLKAGTHYLCTCGSSQKPPYCDGAHQGSQFRPIALELDQPKTVEVTGSLQS